MLFNSLAFGIFLPVVFVLHWAVPHKFRWALLLIASYYFYMSWKPAYVLLIFAMTLVSYCAGLLIKKADSVAMKKLVLVLAVLLCLGTLFFFKYFDFFFDSISAVLGLFSIQFHPNSLKVLLPVGISFYTFQTLSYVIDVYRGTAEPETHFGLYATFISFFPQLVAGPIERTSSLLPQIKAERKFSYEQATYGLKLMAWGFFKKLLIADIVAGYVDSAYANLPQCTGFDLVATTFFFALQIYCDFSGYSDIAIGTAKLLGINLTTNFKSPYFSKSIKEFWSRWHISLSTWLRDYVYIPLGGSRCSKAMHYRNLLITFLASGLWHGANLTFVVWGGLHGIAQILEHALAPKNRLNQSAGKLRTAVQLLMVFVFCNVAWVFFRAETLKDALYVLTTVIKDFAEPSQFLHSSEGVVGLYKKRFLRCMLPVLVLAAYDFASFKTDVIAWLGRQRLVVRWAVYIIMGWCLFLIIGWRYTAGAAAPSEFIYFQF